MNLESLSLDRAKNLRRGEILYHTKNVNADGTPQRWRVNGLVKTWVRNPKMVKVPIKNGLRNCSYITEYDLGLVQIEVERRAPLTKQDALQTVTAEREALQSAIRVWFFQPDTNGELLKDIRKGNCEFVLSFAHSLVERYREHDKFVYNQLYQELTNG
jgi:antitoxin component YwqK of YwqJK toxin-antitoxin module